MNALGSLSYEKKEDSSAVEWFRKASEQGCPRGLNNLGVCFELGKGVEADTDQAFHMYKESAEKGYVAGMHSLA
jgi:TPR repeat protein